MLASSTLCLICKSTPQSHPRLHLTHSAMLYMARNHNFQLSLDGSDRIPPLVLTSQATNPFQQVWAKMRFHVLSQRITYTPCPTRDHESIRAVRTSWNGHLRDSLHLTLQGHVVLQNADVARRLSSTVARRRRVYCTFWINSFISAVHPVIYNLPI